MTKLSKRPRLDYVTALQAVADYQLIVTCGALTQFESELRAAYREAEADRQRLTNSAFFAVHFVPRDLGRVLGISPAELVPAAEAYFLGADRTGIVLRVLRDLADRVRHELRLNRRGA